MQQHLVTCGRTLEHAAAPLARGAMYKKSSVMEKHAIAQLV